MFSGWETVRTPSSATFEERSRERTRRARELRQLGALVLAIPAAKGVEFGSGFAAARMEAAAARLRAEASRPQAAPR